MRGTDPMDALFDMLIEDQAQTERGGVRHERSPTSRSRCVQPWVSFCNDSAGTSPDGVLGKGFPHPRAYGTFPRVLRKYVREERRMRLEEAIRKFTSLPASRLRLADRGVLKEGMWATSWCSIRTPSPIARPSPHRISSAGGMQWVLVNGVAVIADGKATHALPGRVLRGRGAAPEEKAR